MATQLRLRRCQGNRLPEWNAASPCVLTNSGSGRMGPKLFVSPSERDNYWHVLIGNGGCDTEADKHIIQVTLSPVLGDSLVQHQCRLVTSVDNCLSSIRGYFIPGTLCWQWCISKCIQVRKWNFLASTGNFFLNHMGIVRRRSVVRANITFVLCLFSPI